MRLQTGSRLKMLPSPGDSAKRAQSFLAKQISASGQTFVRVIRRADGADAVDKLRTLMRWTEIRAAQVPGLVLHHRQVFVQRRSEPKRMARLFVLHRQILS